MREWSTTGDDGAVRVQNPDGEILGSGFLVRTRDSELRALTCAHVVEDLEEVEVVFLADPGAGARAAQVVVREHDRKGRDFAVLELLEEPPAAARPLRLEPPSAGNRFRALGFPEGYDHGLWVKGNTAGANLLGWVQIEPDGARDVALGFSGGAAWSDERRVVVGMIVARSGKRVAWMVPAGLLGETLPEVAVVSAPPPPVEPSPFRSMAVPPEQYVDRVEYGCVLDTLTGTGGNTVALTTALRGAGGYGKTTLAQALCADSAVRAAYPAGVLWTTMGESLRPADRLARLRDLLRFWNEEEPPAFETATAAGAALRQTLAGHRVLLVVDDVWDPADLAPLHGLGGEAALLVTTRDRRNVPRDAVLFDIDEMRRDEAVALLAASLPAAEVAERRKPLRALAHRLGEWPLLLSLVNRQLVDLVRDGLDVGAALAEVNRSLDAYGLEAFDRDDTEARTEAVSRTLAVSLDRLKEEERARFFALAVFPEDAEVPLAVVAPFWGLSLTETTRQCARLRDLSLLRELDRAGGTLRLHDVVRAYLHAHSPSPEAELHRLLLAALRPASGDWKDLPPEPIYSWRHLADHLVVAGRADELRDLLFDLDWLEAKLHRIGVNALLADCMPLLGEEEMEQLHGTLRLSAHVLGRNPNQLASQLTSRLGSAGGRLHRLIDDCRRRGGLHHLHPGSIGPGGPLLRTLEGQTSPVLAVAVLDERCVISASGDGNLRLWDLDTGETLRTLQGHTDWVRAVAVLDERRVVSASDDRTLRLWDLDTGETLRTFEGHSGRVTAVAVLGERRLISASDRRTLRLWDLDTGEMLGTLEGHTSPVRAVAVLNERHVISASDRRTLRLWDLDTGQTLRTFKGHTDGVRSVAVLDERRVVSASDDRTLRLWDLDTGETLRTLEGHTGKVRAVAVLDERRVVSASDDRTLRLWDLNTGETLRTFDGHIDGVSAVAVLDERRVVSASDDGTLRLWDLDPAATLRRFEGHASEVLAVAMIDERHVVSASDDRTLRLWDLDTGETLRTLDGHTNRVSAVAVLDERRVVSASDDCTLRLWDLDTGETLRTLEGHTGRMRAMAVLNERSVISASDDGTLRLWDLENGKTLRTLEGHTHWVQAVAVLDERRVVSASFDGTLRLWDLDTGETLRTLEGHTDGVGAVAVLDERRVVSASYDLTLRVWDLDTGETLSTLINHATCVQALAVIDERRVISASIYGALLLWELRTGTTVRSLEGHAGRVHAVAVLDDRRVVSAYNDSTLRLWDLEKGRQVAIATLDGPVIILATHHPTRTIVAGEASGRVHFLRYFEPAVATTPSPFPSPLTP